MHRGTIGLALLVNACASAAPYRAPDVRVPAAFQQRLDSLGVTALPRTVPVTAASDTLPAVGEYWQALGDSVLNQLLDRALRDNLDVEAARARIRGARASRTGAALDFVPTVTAVAGYTRQRLAGASFPIGGGAFPDQDGVFDQFVSAICSSSNVSVQARSRWLAKSAGKGAIHFRSASVPSSREG